mgnify:CR=1 FL=1
MPVSSRVLFDDIVREFPSDWDFSNPKAANARWLLALCDGFVAMWSAGLTIPGPGPDPSTSNLYPHTHTIASAPGLLGPVMSAVPNALFVGANGASKVYADVIALKTAEHLLATCVSDEQSGQDASHVHLWPVAVQPEILQAAIISELAQTGLFNIPQSTIPQWLEGYSKGLQTHLTENATTSIPVVAGVLHTHTLL